MVSMVFFMVTIGTIDSKDTGPLHTPCAVAFFVILMVEIIVVTIYLNKLRRYDTTVLTHDSLVLKNFLAALISLIWIYSIAMIIYLSMS